MKNTLIIKEADFSSNAIEQTSIYNNIPLEKSNIAAFYLDYQGIPAIRQTQTNNAIGMFMKLFAADVSGYVGQTIVITTAHPIVADAYYAAFTSDLGGFTLNDISSLSGVAPGAEPIITPVTTVGSSFNISSTNCESATITKVVPSGAQYLLFAANFSSDLTESDVKVVIDAQL